MCLQQNFKQIVPSIVSSHRWKLLQFFLFLFTKMPPKIRSMFDTTIATTDAMHPILKRQPWGERTHTVNSDRVETTKHSCRRLHIKYNQFARGFLQWQWQKAWRTRPKIQNTCSDHRIKIIKFKCFCMTRTRACANMHIAHTHEPDYTKRRYYFLSLCLLAILTESFRTELRSATVRNSSDFIYLCMGYSTGLVLFLPASIMVIRPSNALLFFSDRTLSCCSNRKFVLVEHIT